MKLFFSSVFLTWSFSAVFAQNFLNKDFHTVAKFEAENTVFILIPSDTDESVSDIFDLDKKLVGREEKEIKQAGEQSYLIRTLYFFDENKNVRERHKLTNLKNNIRNSIYLNQEQQVIRQEQWKDGILTYRSTMDPITHEIVTDKIILSGPIGGEQVWNEYVMKTIRYPREARLKRLSGTVYVTFEIDSRGNLGSIKVADKNKIHSSLSHEAKRLISQYKGGWRPYEINGEAMTSSLTIPIVFNMVFKQL